MKKNGPWQHCDKCEKGMAHFWTAELIYSCSGCGKETKVTAATALKRIKSLLTHDPLFQVLDPATDEQKMAMNPGLKIERLTVSEIKEKYGDLFTEKQIESLEKSVKPSTLNWASKL